MKRFSCQRCGACCNNIQGNFKEEEIREIKMAFKKLENQGIYLAVKPEKFSIPLFPHEAKKMRELASKIGIDFFPVPKLFMIDSKTGYCMVLEWDLGHSNCPFFDNDKCLIHNDRPLACQSFPIFPYSFSSSPEEYILLGRCPQSKKYRELSKEEIEKCFESEICALRRFSEHLNSIKGLYHQLVVDGVIKPIKTGKETAKRLLKQAEKEGKLISIEEFVK